MTYQSCFAQCTGDYKHLDLATVEPIRFDILYKIEQLMTKQNVTFEQLTAKLKELKWNDYKIDLFFNPYTDIGITEMVDVFLVLGHELHFDFISYGELESKTDSTVTIELCQRYQPPKSK